MQGRLCYCYRDWRNLEGGSLSFCLFGQGIRSVCSTHTWSHIYWTTKDRSNIGKTDRKGIFWIILQFCIDFGLIDRHLGVFCWLVLNHNINIHSLEQSENPSQYFPRVVHMLALLKIIHTTSPKKTHVY